MAHKMREAEDKGGKEERLKEGGERGRERGRKERRKKSKKENS